MTQRPFHLLEKLMGALHRGDLSPQAVDMLVRHAALFTELAKQAATDSSVLVDIGQRTGGDATTAAYLSLLRAAVHQTPSPEVASEVIVILSMCRRAMTSNEGAVQANFEQVILDSVRVWISGWADGPRGAVEEWINSLVGSVLLSRYSYLYDSAYGASMYIVPFDDIERALGQRGLFSAEDRAALQVLPWSAQQIQDLSSNGGFVLIPVHPGMTGELFHNVTFGPHRNRAFVSGNMPDVLDSDAFLQHGYSSLGWVAVQRTSIACDAVSVGGVIDRLEERYRPIGVLTLFLLHLLDRHCGGEVLPGRSVHCYFDAGGSLEERNNHSWYFRRCENPTFGEVARFGDRSTFGCALFLERIPGR